MGTDSTALTRGEKAFFLDRGEHGSCTGLIGDAHDLDRGLREPRPGVNVVSQRIEAVESPREGVPRELDADPHGIT
jgi:hypothetical protein